MNGKTRFISIAVLLIVAAAALFAISRIQREMNDIRNRQQTVQAETMTDAPPVIVFTTQVMGAFRGLLADWLWLRARKMKREGNYFEMVQLSSWIVKLQPHFAGAAAYLGWNMAYNVSVTFADPKDRWRWVQRGIELIRDQALEYNPTDPELYHELGWIYMHKVGQTLDDAHRYYKTQMAQNVTRVLGGYPPDWAALADAPRTRAQLRRAMPETFSFEQLQKLLTENDTSLGKLETEFRNAGGLPAQWQDKLPSDQVRHLLENYFRTRWLKDRYRLDPAYVRQLNQKYGALDWRLPQAHAIYWASKGREHGKVGKKWARLVFQALHDAFQNGRLVSAGDRQYVEITNNVAIVDAVNRSYLEHEEKYGWDITKAGYKNFLINATKVLYIHGAEKKAREYQQKGRARYGSKFDGSLIDFVLKTIAGDIEKGARGQIQPMIQQYIRRSCLALATGRPEQAAKLEDIAHQIWKRYMSDITDERERRRRGLPPYKVTRSRTVNRALQQFSGPLAESLREALGQSSDLEKGNEEEKSGETQ